MSPFDLNRDQIAHFPRCITVIYLTIIEVLKDLSYLGIKEHHVMSHHVWLYSNESGKSKDTVKIRQSEQSVNELRSTYYI